MSIDDIVIVEYDLGWPLRYAEERSSILAALGDQAVDIEHFGSTSVPGLSAKPIIDIMTAMRGLPVSEAHVAALEKLGYEFMRYNEPWWAFLRKGMPRTHQLHLLDVNHESAREHRGKQVLFRDYLRVHLEDARDYASLKLKLAARFTQDRPAYEEHKTEFILATLKKARSWPCEAQMGQQELGTS